MPATLGDVIRERRMELDLTQEELAERVGEGVRQSDISRLERNRVGLPRRHRMEELAAALDIPIGVLLSRSGWAGAEAIDGSTLDLDSGIVAPEVPADPSDQPVPDPDDAEAAPPGWAAEDDDREDPWHQAVDGKDDRGTSWFQEDSEMLRDTVSRTESMIEQSRSRIRDAESTMERGRRSIQRGQPADST